MDADTAPIRSMFRRIMIKMRIFLLFKISNPFFFGLDFKLIKGSIWHPGRENSLRIEKNLKAAGNNRLFKFLDYDDWQVKPQKTIDTYSDPGPYQIE